MNKIDRLTESNESNDARLDFASLLKALRACKHLTKKECERVMQIFIESKYNMSIEDLVDVESDYSEAYIEQFDKLFNDDSDDFFVAR